MSRIFNIDKYRKWCSEFTDYEEGDWALLCKNMPVFEIGKRLVCVGKDNEVYYISKDWIDITPDEKLKQWLETYDRHDFRSVLKRVLLYKEIEHEQR